MTMAMLSSCKFKKIDDAMFPEEKLYIAAAANGIYWINSVPSSANLPTPGNPSRFSTNLSEGRMIVPLGIYRGGISNSNTVEVTMTPKTDTVQKLIANGQLNGATLLPSEKYNINSALVIPHGQTTGFSDLNVDLNFLKSNPNQIYAIAIEASSSQRTMNPLLNTVVVVIDTRLLVPSANFSYKVDATDWKKITFNNTSSNIISSEWDFGDGTSSMENQPLHTFPSAGVVRSVIARGLKPGAARQGRIPDCYRP
ncbi:MAG: DUF1735 domain-containing protein [Sphingobacteriales bacterium]|nr:MAG: DUF1735 domain-containing protein [Sphingobacteriales bacterium]